MIGIARLSNNWLVARLAGFYIEDHAEHPLLLQLVFWYGGSWQALPVVKKTASVCSMRSFLNKKGLYVLEPIFQPGAGWVLAGFIVAVIASVLPSSLGTASPGRRPDSSSRCLPSPP